MQRSFLNLIHWSLFLSLLLHFGFGLYLQYAPTHKNQVNDQIEVDFIDASHLKNIKQIVDQGEKPLNDEKPDDAKYLSAHNQKVVKQTIAKNRGEFKNAKNLNPMNAFKPNFDASKTFREKIEREIEQEKILDRDAIVVDAKKKMEEQKNKKQNSGGEVSQTSDYVKDTDTGIETLLSTREFIYYSYYSRIRQQLSQHWGPKVKEKLTKLYRQGRMIASSDDKITRCLVILDAKGNLIKVQILSNSGVRDLDDAAVEAFRAAGPFPNPPAGIVEGDGTIKIRWDFILEA